MQRIIIISIDYFKFKSVIKIDIKQRTELSIIPTFSLGLTDNKYTDKESNFNEYLNNLFVKNFTSNSILDQNHTRNGLFINTQHKELSRFLSLKLGNEILNLSTFRYLTII